MLGRSVLSRNVIRKLFSPTIRLGSGHHGPPMPPYGRLAPPAPGTSLPRDVELVWDDSVAPETCVDFDAPHVDTGTAVKSFLAGLGFFVVLYQLVKLSDPASRNPVAPRSAILDKSIFREAMGMDEV